MSEIINNREYRQKVLKEIIGDLHRGKPPEEVKARFEELIKGVSASEISEMEAALIAEGMPVEEIQRLCDVHAAVFKGSIEEIHQAKTPGETPGHPIHTFMQENKAIERLIGRITSDLDAYRNDPSEEKARKVREGFEQLKEIDRHYLRKENLLFPYMEKYGITAPPKVMWGVDDEIREHISDVIGLFGDSDNPDRDRLSEKAQIALDKVREMIFKEENILFPMVAETLTEDEWMQIRKESDEFGYTLYKPTVEWKPARTDIREKAKNEGTEIPGEGYVRFDAGVMTPEEINAVLNTLPFDMTFVDRNGAVKYFTMGKDRIFARPKSVLGRQVHNCHPPASVHVVEKIVEDLKSGRKDHEDFWIRMGSRFVYIRYFAVRNSEGEFLGVLEVTQDIGPIQELTGEKRLLSD